MRIRKKLLSCLLAVALLAGTLALPARAAFRDIRDRDTAVAAAVLEGLGIVTGTDVGVFSPDTPLTRAQFCTLAVRAMGLSDQVESYARKYLFSDVPPGAWHAGYVNLAYEKGVVNGYGNGLFGPDDSVNYGQVATILLRLLGYTSAEIGNVWPIDYVNYANDIDLSEGLSLRADSVVTRGQAAVLLYNTIDTEPNGGQQPYYMTMNGVASAEAAIILDNNATNGGSTGLLQTYVITATGSELTYYTQKNVISSDLAGSIGALLLNSAGRVVGFVPDSTEYQDVVIGSAKVSGITASDGTAYRVTGSATVICGSELYTYNTSGYLQVDNQKGKTARLFYDDDGAVKYVYIPSGAASAGTAAAVASANGAAGELAQKLGISGPYNISKNGVAATAANIARNDVGYYDAATRTLYVSDYRVTGYIGAASPSVGAAETITVAGCPLRVLESAWDTLDDFSLGDMVTLLLTDDCQVAAAVAATALSADMVGILSADGMSVALVGSGLVLTANEVHKTDRDIIGSLVRVRVTSQTGLQCSRLSTPSGTGTLNTEAGTMGSYTIAPGCSIFELASGTGTLGSVYSLAGVPGQSSADFDDLLWTTSLPASRVAYYRLNEARQVDIIVLNDVTGNCYQYGGISYYYDKAGINLGTPAMDAWTSAVSVTNSTKVSGIKYLNFHNLRAGSYGGLAITPYNAQYHRISATASLTSKGGVTAGSFFLRDEDWYVAIDGNELPVSVNVEIYTTALKGWSGGTEALLSALAGGKTLALYHDRTPQTGAQIRVIVVPA